MGKLLITNCQEWNESLRSLFRTTGFTEGAHVAFDEVYLTTYKKLNVNNCNFFPDKGNWAACAGTLFYKELFGKNALEAVLHDAQTMSVQELRANLVGSYVLAVKDNEHIRIFVDEACTYAFYYYVDEKRYLMTNTFYHVQKCALQPLDAYTFLERGVCSGVVGHLTPYEGIRSLRAEEYAQIDLESGSFAIRSCPLNDYSCCFKSIEDAVTTVWERAQAVAGLRSRYINKYLHFVTGGLDSRVELSASLSNHDQVSIGYWSGEDVITNGTVEDRAIGESIAEAFDLPYTFFDVAQSFEEVLNDLDRRKCNKYGEYADIYAGNGKWLSIFESASNVEFLGFGFLCENLKPSSDLDRYYNKDYFTLGDFVRHVHCRSGIEKELCALPGFYSRVEDEFRAATGLSGTAPLSKDDCYRAIECARASTNAVRYNLCNVFAYSFSVLGDKKTLDAIVSIPYEWRKGDRLSLLLTRKWEAKLLDYPYYSHHCPMTYDKETGLLRAARKRRIVDLLKSHLTSTWMYDRVYLKALQKRLHPRTEKNAELFSFSIDYLDRSPTIKMTNIELIKPKTWSGVELATLATFVAQTKVADELLNQ